MHSYFFGYDSGEYYNLALLLERYPHLYYEEETLSFYGVLWDEVCVRDGRGFHISACYPEYEAECPGRFMPEIIPNRPGCLGSPEARDWTFLARTREPLPASEPSSSLGVTYSSPSLDNGQIIRYEIPLEASSASVQVRAIGLDRWDPAALREQYPHLYFSHEEVYFYGTLASDICTATDAYYETGCSERYEEECGGVYMDEIVPGHAGCLDEDSETRKSLRANFSYEGSGGTFTIPEGARSFHLVSMGKTPVKLVSPDGKEYSHAGYGEPGWSAQVRLDWDAVITQATSDLDYTYDDVVAPGEWTIEFAGTSWSAPPTVVIKTRNDPDDRLRLKIVNATTRANEDFMPRLGHMVELAAHLGINLEISGIEKIRHRSNPHNPPSDFCERFCSSDEAVVFITEPGGWSSPGPGIALKVDYNTHFLVGAEVATHENDHYLASALHELLHYAAGLGHLFETHKDGNVDADDLKSTGVHNEVVGPETKIAGGVNHERLWERGELLWDDNIMIGWRMTHDEPDVDGFGETDADGRRRALVTFLEHHQLEWLKNSPFYW